MTPAELKAHVSATGSNFFDRKTMQHFGDTMRNYKVVGPITIATTSGETCQVWELQRKKPAIGKAYGEKYTSSAFFRADDYKRVFASGYVEANTAVGNLH